MIEWKLEKRKVSSLKDYHKNPRKLSKHDAEHLQKSLEKFGLIDKPIINPDGVLIGGHQRKNILKKLKVKEIECWVPERALDEKEVEELNVRLNRATGEWDWEVLGNQWEPDELIEWGFTPEEMFGNQDEPQVIDDIALPDGEKGFCTMSFTLTEDQKKTVEHAIDLSKKLGNFVETGNENINGNAITRICEMFNP